MLASAKWALIFYTVHVSPGGEESLTYHRDATGYETLAMCQQAGNDALAVIDMAPDYHPYFACVPVDAITKSQKRKSSQ